MWTAQTAPMAGNRTEGWHCWTSPEREELVYPNFPAFLCWWVLVLLKGTMGIMGSTSRNLKALGQQGDEGITMPRCLNLRGCAWFLHETEPCPCLPRQLVDSGSLGHLFSQKLKLVTQPKCPFLGWHKPFENKQTKNPLEAQKRPVNHKDLVR